MCDYKSGAEQNPLCVRGPQLHLRYLPPIAHRRGTGGVCLRATRACVCFRERAAQGGWESASYAAAPPTIRRRLSACTACEDKTAAAADAEGQAVTLLVRQVK